jgi:hypothetical protein
MARTQDPRTGSTWWFGPVAFAAVMITIAGLFNLTTGLAAMASDDVFVTGSDGALVLNSTGWGWVHFIFGGALVATGVGVLMGQLWAQLVAIVLVGVNMVSQLLALPAYPLWSIVIIAVDALVLWALMNHSQEVSLRD